MVLQRLRKPGLPFSVGLCLAAARNLPRQFAYVLPGMECVIWSEAVIVWFGLWVRSRDDMLVDE